MLRAVLLDVDGTLIDSNDQHAESWAEVLKANGHPVSFEEIRRLIGMGGDKLLSTTVQIDEESDEGKRISEERSELFKERYLPHLKAFPGVKELLARMHDQGLRLAVASSAREDELKTLLELAGATDLIEAQASSSEVENSKPDPDLVQTALAKLDCPAEEVLMLGDTPYDIEAAGKAGVGVIALRCGGWRDADLQGAVAIYTDAADLLAQYDRSPLAAANGRADAA